MVYSVIVETWLAGSRGDKRSCFDYQINVRTKGEPIHAMRIGQRAAARRFLGRNCLALHCKATTIGLPVNFTREG